MKRKLLITTALLCFFGVALAFVADINGKWSGKLAAPDGNEYPLSYTFKADGDKLTGSGTSQQGEVPIGDGKLKSDSLSFTVDVGGVTVLNSGKYFAAGDSISLNVDYQGYKMHTTLKRDASK